MNPEPALARGTRIDKHQILARVMRPRSIATVVLRLSGGLQHVDAPAEASVTIASVRNGMISKPTE